MSTQLCSECETTTCHRSPVNPYCHATVVGGMSADDREELFGIVRAELQRWDPVCVADAILSAHQGRPQWFVTEDNMHLFRRYRNNVSANPYDMINEALGEEVTA